MTDADEEFPKVGHDPGNADGREVMSPEMRLGAGRLGNC